MNPTQTPLKHETVLKDLRPERYHEELRLSELRIKVEKQIKNVGAVIGESCVSLADGQALVRYSRSTF